MEGIVINAGMKNSDGLEPLPELKEILPFFHDAKRIIPYETEDTARMQARMNCPSAKWYTVIRDETTNRFLKEVQRKRLSGKENLVTELCLASELGSMDKTEAITFLLELNGIGHDGKPKRCLYYLEAPGQKVLSAAFVVAVYESLLEKGILSGIGGSEKIKDPLSVFNKMQQYGVMDLQIIPDAQLTDSEEGFL